MKIFILALFILASVSTEACFIIIGKKNGRVFIGNNEDWDRSNAKYWIEKPRTGKGDKYSALFFGFKGEFTTAQGGFNDQGLFFDATAVPKLTLSDSAMLGKEKAIHPIFKNILRKCATVEEAIALLDKYYIPFIKKVQIILADATGAYVVLNVNGIAERGNISDGYRIITNFHANAKHHFCYRYDSADARLQKHFENTPEEITSILSMSHQDFPGATVYSNVYNLTNRSVQIFYNHRFDNSLTADFKTPMPEKFVYLEEQFPRRMIRDLIDIHKRKGVQAAIAFYKMECEKPKSEFECDVEQLSDLTTRLINQQHFSDGLVVAQENASLFPDNDKVHEQLGKALIYLGSIDDAKMEYQKALTINPTNRWATYVLNQYKQVPKGEINVRLKGFSDSKIVTLAGEFNEWQDLRNICFKNEQGVWDCKLSIPSGNYPYRFLADGKFIDDPSNPPTVEIQKGFFVSELKVP